MSIGKLIVFGARELRHSKTKDKAEHVTAYLVDIPDKEPEDIIPLSKRVRFYISFLDLYSIVFWFAFILICLNSWVSMIFIIVGGLFLRLPISDIRKFGVLEYSIDNEHVFLRVDNQEISFDLASNNYIVVEKIDGIPRRLSHFSTETNSAGRHFTRVINDFKIELDQFTLFKRRSVNKELMPLLELLDKKGKIVDIKVRGKIRSVNDPSVFVHNHNPSGFYEPENSDMSSEVFYTLWAAAISGLIISIVLTIIIYFILLMSTINPFIEGIATRIDNFGLQNLFAYVFVYAFLYMIRNNREDPIS